MRIGIFLEAINIASGAAADLPRKISTEIFFLLKYITPALINACLIPTPLTAESRAQHSSIELRGGKICR